MNDILSFQPDYKLNTSILRKAVSKGKKEAQPDQIGLSVARIIDESADGYTVVWEVDFDNHSSGNKLALWNDVNFRRRKIDDVVSEILGAWDAEWDIVFVNGEYVQRSTVGDDNYHVFNGPE